MEHDKSIPVAPSHARACNAVLCLQTAYATSLRHRLTPYGSQFHSQTGLPLFQESRSEPEMLQISQSATLKIHRKITASAANASGSVQTTLSKLPRMK